MQFIDFLFKNQYINKYQMRINHIPQNNQQLLKKIPHKEYFKKYQKILSMVCLSNFYSNKFLQHHSFHWNVQTFRNCRSILLQLPAQLLIWYELLLRDLQLLAQPGQDNPPCHGGRIHHLLYETNFVNILKSRVSGALML